MQHLVEAFLLIAQPRQRIAHWTDVLGPLDSPKAPPLANVTAYYDPTTDEAILRLRYDALALGDAHLGYIVEVALSAEIGMVQPAELTESERRRFVTDRLSRCTLHIDHQRSVLGGLTQLVKLVREARAMARPQVVVGRVPTVQVARGTRDDMKPVAKPRLGTNDDVKPPRPITNNDFDGDTERRATPTKVRTREHVTTVPYIPPNAPEPARAGVIYARYLRSGRWVPIRIGALSLKGATLLTGALPRLRDNVDIALAFGTNRALVRGSVSKLASEADGVATFTVDFELDEPAKRQLTALLTAARAANITIKPPPPRIGRRFPVEWPVCLGTPRGAVRGHALDISHDGMFVRPANALALDTHLNFSAVLDDGEGPVSGRARVVRHVSEATARTAGLTPGYGLQIVEMGDADRARWTAFVERIERRAAKRVLIGASPARLSELQSALAALGYAVTGGTDPGALVQLARGETRPVDAALIDASWLAPSVSTQWVESLFSARDVPCLTLHGDPRGARQAVDKLLLGD